MTRQTTAPLEDGDPVHECAGPDCEHDERGEDNTDDDPEED